MEGDKFCCYCGRPIRPPLILTQEHLVPVCKGGNNRDKKLNLQDCCNICNGWRGHKSLTKWKTLVQSTLDGSSLKTTKWFTKYYKQDLETILMNIDYWVEHMKKYNLTENRKGQNKVAEKL